MFVGTQSQSVAVVVAASAAVLAADVPCRRIILQAKVGNVAAVTIVGRKTDGTFDSDGPTLAAGAFWPTVIELSNLNQLGCKGTAADVLNVFIVR